MPGKDLEELTKAAVSVRALYDAATERKCGRAWNHEEIMLGFMGDVGELSTLVQGKSGVRPRDDLDAALGHELADCLWSILVLAHEYGINLESEFLATMRELTQKLDRGES